MNTVLTKVDSIITCIIIKRRLSLLCSILAPRRLFLNIEDLLYSLVCVAKIILDQHRHVRGVLM